MATYIEKHSIVTEDTLNVDHNSRATFQHVKFMNPQNEYCGFITSNSYHILDDQSKTTYNMSVKDGHLLLSSNAGEVKLVDFSQIKDILSYDAVEDSASIPSIKLLSTLHSMYIAEMQKLNSTKVALSGENEISGENAIEQLSSKLIVADELSAAQLSVLTLNDFFADGKSLSSILQNTDTNVVQLCADLSDEVSNLSNALSNELNTLSIDVATVLNSKQDKLTDMQIFAIDSIVDERQTEVKFGNGTTTRYDVDGELTQAMRQSWESEVGSTVAEVRIGSTVTSIGENAFYYCSGLTSVTIPDNVTSIGRFVFLNCNRLSTIIVEGKTQAEAEALLANTSYPEGCEIKTWNDASQEWVEEQGYLTTNDVDNKWLPLSGGTVRNLSAYNPIAFIDGTGYSNKFTGSSGGDFNYQTFDSNGQAVGGVVLMPHGSTELIVDKYFKTRHIACIDDIVEALDNYLPLSNKQYDFNDQNAINTALYDIISALGGTVVNFSPSSEEQDAIRELYPEGTVESIDQLTHGLKYEFNDDEHTASLLAFANDNSVNNSYFTGSVIVPPYVDKQGNVSLFNNDNFYKVTLIAGTENVYSDNLILKSIIAPSTVLSVEDYAFASCVELSSAMFNSIKYIGNNAFDYCEKLKTADIYTVEYIGQYAFANCILLDIGMPFNHLSTVSKGAFSYCENLSSMTLPVLEVVEQNTFDQCHILSSIFLPAVKHINAAFDGDFNIKVINFGNELENLPTFSNGAFIDVKCKFIVPDNLYDSLSDGSWGILYYDSNYEFVKYSANV